MDQTIQPYLGPLPILAWIPLFPLLGALFNLVVGRWFSRRVVHAVAVGLAIVVAVFRGRRNVEVDRLTTLRH